jgi:hypothetical protein
MIAFRLAVMFVVASLVACVHTSPASIATERATPHELERLDGRSVCVTGIVSWSTHGVYFPLPRTKPDALYGDRIGLSLRPLQARDRGIDDEENHTLCGTLEDLRYRGPDGGSQNAYLLRVH